MRVFLIGALSISLAGAIACSDPAATGTESPKPTPTPVAPTAPTAPPAQKKLTEIDPKQDIGVGTVKTVTLKDLDTDMAAAGKVIFKAKCSACHKIKKRYIGPGLKGVTERRRPEWIMNMIMDPELMMKENFTARALLAEYNAPMANQQINQEDARKLLEYFRSIDRAKSPASAAAKPPVAAK